MTDTCPICLEELDGGVSPYTCGHKMHAVCDCNWTISCIEAMRHSTCPVCRSGREKILTVLFSTSTANKTAMWLSDRQLVLSWSSHRNKDLANDVAESTNKEYHMYSHHLQMDNVEDDVALSMLSKWFKSTMVYITRYALSGGEDAMLHGAAQCGSQEFECISRVFHATIVPHDNADCCKSLFGTLANLSGDITINMRGHDRISLKDLCSGIAHHSFGSTHGVLQAD